MSLKIILFVSAVFISDSFAGDLSNLPDSQQAFYDKINLFIPANSKLSEAIELLHNHDFRCTEISALGWMFHCTRNQGGALGSGETIHEVWLEYNNKNKIININTGVTILPGIEEMILP